MYRWRVSFPISLSLSTVSVGRMHVKENLNCARILKRNHENTAVRPSKSTSICHFLHLSTTLCELINIFTRQNTQPFKTYHAFYCRRSDTVRLATAVATVHLHTRHIVAPLPSLAILGYGRSCRPRFAKLRVTGTDDDVNSHVFSGNVSNECTLTGLLSVSGFHG